MQGIREIPEERGIIPNSFAHIFGHIAKAEGSARCAITVLISFTSTDDPSKQLIFGR